MNKFFVPLLLLLAAGYVLWHFNTITWGFALGAFTFVGMVVTMFASFIAAIVLLFFIPGKDDL